LFDKKGIKQYGGNKQFIMKTKSIERLQAVLSKVYQYTDEYDDNFSIESDPNQIVLKANNYETARLLSSPILTKMFKDVIGEFGPYIFEIRIAIIKKMRRYKRFIWPKDTVCHHLTIQVEKVYLSQDMVQILPKFSNAAGELTNEIKTCRLPNGRYLWVDPIITAITINLITDNGSNDKSSNVN